MLAGSCAGSALASVRRLAFCCVGDGGNGLGKSQLQRPDQMDFVSRAATKAGYTGRYGRCLDRRQRVSGTGKMIRSPMEDITRRGT